MFHLESHVEIHQIRSSEGAIVSTQDAQSLKQNVSKNLSRILSSPKNTPVLDVKKSKKSIGKNQRISSRVRKQTKVRSALLSLHRLAEKLHKIKI